MLIPWYYKAAASAALLAAVVWVSYARGRSDERAVQVASELAQTKEVLKGFENQALAINGLAGQYTQIAQGLSTEIDALSGRFRHAARAAPLSPECRPDPVRVQFLIDAIRTANAAIGRGAGPAVPADTPTR